MSSIVKQLVAPFSVIFYREEERWDFANGIDILSIQVL